MRALLAAAILLVCSSAAHADPRADAINGILPGEPLRIQAAGSPVEGTFVTNRSDSLLLRHAADRMALSYSDIERLEVRRPSTSTGLVIGMILGGVGVGAALAAGGTAPFVGAAAGTFLGGFLGGAIGSGFSHWHRLYESSPPPPERH